MFILTILYCSQVQRRRFKNVGDIIRKRNNEYDENKQMSGLNNLDRVYVNSCCEVLLRCLL